MVIDQMLNEVVIKVAHIAGTAGLIAEKPFFFI